LRSDSTTVKAPVTAFIAPARYRFSFWPGVTTSFCWPRFIQSSPIFGFRWMSTPSRYTATSLFGSRASTRRILRRRRFFAVSDQGQRTTGRGRPRRAPIFANARLIVVTWIRCPVRRARQSTSNSRVHVGRRYP
jgi:hypothetical protein